MYDTLSLEEGIPRPKFAMTKKEANTMTKKHVKCKNITQLA
jgi:hypothetical protein